MERSRPNVVRLQGPDGKGTRPAASPGPGPALAELQTLPTLAALFLVLMKTWI